MKRWRPTEEQKIRRARIRATRAADRRRAQREIMRKLLRSEKLY